MQWKNKYNELVANIEQQRSSSNSSSSSSSSTDSSNNTDSCTSCSNNSTASLELSNIPVAIAVSVESDSIVTPSIQQ